MTLNEFLEKYDKPNSVVLLEGKRNVLVNDKSQLIALGKLLATKSKNIIFRSGNADGADYLFSQGVAEVAKNRLEVVTPYSGHRQKYNLANKTFSLDDIAISDEIEVLRLSKGNKKTKKLVEQYSNGIINRITLKAAYIIRDTIKVIGSKQINPATFGIFYDDMQNPMNSGTGHTMNVCIENNIPLIDQNIWFKWL